MTSVIELYEQISSAPDEKTRARLIVEAIEHVERRFPAVNDLATNASLRETELRLQKEIEQLRGDIQKEIEQLRGGLQKEIEQLRGETRQIEGNLHRDIEQLRTETAHHKVDIIKWTLGALLAYAVLILGAMRFLVG
ncbi:MULTISPECIES: coiled-coil domain-containing protein [unclassified Ectothiorhodospira]|uniref:coiled-coil domain-containing protein n=1 Tax=unclassified Ectothiorhodospira TaxID=2684909 RepID=UPI001EE922AD|nr:MULTISPECIES: coiled-coil domain-containing protein [unclassified Ectothiorhodospira]MCG5517168.1 CCDC90 family protein [Ectothiorhodospira sp. 9100]MCG5520105.1 CCDC90 family protein [Ectothiorhodospira sp. 9905]